MRLEGSCHCGAVRFTVDSHTPQPYMRCYCSICRKTAGGGGFAINIMGDADTLKIEGKDNLTVYRARRDDGSLSDAHRHFCKHCGSALWLWGPAWPHWVYPLASAIDTPRPQPPESVNLMLNYKPDWADVPNGRKHDDFPEYPEEGIEDWHKRRGLWVD
jgi:hypothetical protein